VRKTLRITKDRSHNRNGLEGQWNELLMLGAEWPLEKSKRIQRTRIYGGRACLTLMEERGLAG